MTRGFSHERTPSGSQPRRAVWRRGLAVVLALVVGIAATLVSPPPRLAAAAHAPADAVILLAASPAALGAAQDPDRTPCRRATLPGPATSCGVAIAWLAPAAVVDAVPPPTAATRPVWWRAASLTPQDLTAAIERPPRHAV